MKLLVRILGILAILLVGTACSDSSESSSSGGGVDPMERIRTEIIEPMGWNDKSVLLYGLDQPLQPGQTLGPAMGIDGEEVEPVTLDRPTWFFWADADPLALFSHRTHFITMDTDGSNFRMEDQSWFPVIDGKIFHPDEPVWSSFDVSALSTGGSAPLSAVDHMLALKALPRRCEGKAYAVVLSGTKGTKDWLMGSAAKLAEKVGNYSYDEVLELGPYKTDAVSEEAQWTNPDHLKTKFFEKLKEWSNKSIQDGAEPIGQLDIFYLGHGDKDSYGGYWGLGDNTQSLVKIYKQDILKALKGAKLRRLNLVIESCHSEAFGQYLDETLTDFRTKGYPEFDTMEVRVVYSAKAGEQSWYPYGSPFAKHLVKELKSPDPTGPLDPTPTAPLAIEDLTLPDTFESVLGPEFKEQGTKVQHPGVIVAPTAVPIFDRDRKAPAGPDCRIAGTVQYNDYERLITLKGSGFGDAKGKVELFRWDYVGSSLGQFPWDPETCGYHVGTAEQLEVTYWKPKEVIVRVPFRTKGFASVPDSLPKQTIEVHSYDPDDKDSGTTHLGYRWEASFAGRYPIGRYFVQLTREDGKKTSSFVPTRCAKGGEEVFPGGRPVGIAADNPHRDRAPQLIYISSMLELKASAPTQDSAWVEWWHPFYSGTAQTGAPTALLSYLGLSSTEYATLLPQFKYKTLFPNTYLLWVDPKLGDQPHVTGPQALAFSKSLGGGPGWGYGLQPGPHDTSLSKHADPSKVFMPNITYWGYRQEFATPWTEGTQQFYSVLIYD